MTPEVLEPSLELLRQEYVLIQAWKKTANYIRYHNWYADTLELDRTTVNLPEFIANISESLKAPEQWESDSLRIVPAPKRQLWRVSPKSGAWEPVEKGTAAAPLRPLAHVSLRDQVVATAVMLCLADRVETEQGDPRSSLQDAEARKQISSYGNRLFCDEINNGLRHRWGSSKLYRSYFEDYRSFISRPVLVAKSIKQQGEQRVFIVESDLSQFYDRVRPDRLARAVASVRRDGDESAFYNFAARVFDWRWHSRDTTDVAVYAEQMGLSDFTRVALPQGLVSAGFFANVILLAFDDGLRGKIGNEIVPGIRLEDACRYVDDLRIVVTADQQRLPQWNLEDGEQTIAQLENTITEWLQNQLNLDAPGLLVSDKKTKTAEFGSSERPLVRQSARMDRIQSAVSGGFDASGGEEILDAIQGLVRSQQALNREPTGSGWTFSPLSDVRDETVARFSAARFRTTYRSIRPLLEDVLPTSMAEETGGEFEQARGVRVARSQQDLDEDARAFALGLIEQWVEDPSNVRLLRIGLDIWPDWQVLQKILDLFRPFTERGGRRKAPRRIAWYCLSELLRAGATETGLVDDAECLPASVDLQKYRETLSKEATRLIQLPTATIPWYLQQQALLFLAVFSPTAAPVVRTGQNTETRDYRKLILFLRREHTRLTSSDFATLAVLTRRAFLDADKSAGIVRGSLTAARKREIAVREPSFARELGETDSHFFEDLPARIREDLCVEAGSVAGGLRSLTEIVLSEGPAGPLRNELSLLRFAAALLRKLQDSEAAQSEVITPGQIRLKLNIEADIAKVEDMEVLASRTAPRGSLYAPPLWCEPSERWRFQLGFLLRFILTRQSDFTRVVHPEYWKERSATYRPVKSHWYLRIYGLFNGQQAFGGDWLPITDWMEQFLLALFRWPGCRTPGGFEWVDDGIEKTQEKVQTRIEVLERKQGSSTGTLLMPMVTARLSKETVSLRACVVQTVVPTADDLDSADLTLSQPDIRRKHRNHLSAALAAVGRMLALRETHLQDGGHLDWLILPELAVHPRDVATHLIPFARAHRTLILAGLTYEELFLDKPPVNSALWIMPEVSRDYGLQIRTRRQGKRHLAPNEEQFNLQSFRPCQWLVGYPWSAEHAPLWLTASVCYDATDLRLAADLRNESDVFAIPAFNKDIKTFDQMALALHYHMFQLVVVANNGQYGGSNAYWPRHGDVQRQLFHLHGQPQASIAFLEIKDIASFLARGNHTTQGNSSLPPEGWKHPPAGWAGSLIADAGIW